MHQPVRPVRTHQWLFGIATFLTICAIPHAIAAFANHLPTALLNLHLTACVALSIHAELRRQWWRRGKDQQELADLVAAAERR